MADGSRHSLFAVKENEYGVTPADPALELVRITGTTLGLTKDSLQSAEIRADRQIADFRLGSNQIGGDITFELGYGSFDNFLEACLLSDDWDSPGQTGTTTISATATGYRRATGSFLSNGFKVGQTVKARGYEGTGHNGLSVVTAVTAQILTTTALDGQHGVEAGTGNEEIVSSESIKSAAQRSSFTFIRQFSDIASNDNPFYVYRGVEFNSLQLTISANAIITGTLSVVGQGQETLSDLTSLEGNITYPEPSATSPLDSFTGTLTEGEDTIAVVTEISLTLENGIAPRYVVGKKNGIYPSVGRSNLTGQITAFFENSTLVNKFIDESESSLNFSLPDGMGNIQKYHIPRLKYTGGQPNVSGEGPVTLAMPFQALLDADNESNLIIERTPA